MVWQRQLQSFQRCGGCQAASLAAQQLITLAIPMACRVCQVASPSGKLPMARRPERIQLKAWGRDKRLEGGNKSKSQHRKQKGVNPMMFADTLLRQACRLLFLLAP